MAGGRVTICLLTYNRLAYATQTLRTTLENIKYNGELAVHIASDGDNDAYIDSLKMLAGGYEGLCTVSSSNSNRNGYGANYNLACQSIHPSSEYILPLEDDWALTRELDLNQLTNALDTGLLGCIRLGYIGFTQPLHAEFMHIANDTYLLLNSESPEPHVFAGHPRLETVNWSRNVGPWPEQILPGQTEFVVAHRKAARERVAWPVNLVKPIGDLFVHIGSERSY